MGFVIGEAVRDLRRAGWIGLSAAVLIALSLVALGAFRVLSVNLGQAVTQWRERVRVVAYLREEIPPQERAEFLRRIKTVGEIGRLQYVSKEAALARLRRSLGDQAGVVEALPANPLPASVEVMPAAGGATPAGTRELIERLAGFPEVEEVQGGTEWVERLAEWQRLVGAVGLGVGGMLALAAILTVTTATTLVLHARRQELEIMRLVGASEGVLRVRFLLQGLFQGLVGGSLALGLLWLAYSQTRPHLEPLLTLTLGLTRATFLSPPEITLLVGGGALLGALGGLLAKGRA